MKSNNSEIVEKVQSWISFNNLELGSDTEHFYLQGDLLDDLSKYIISNAENRARAFSSSLERYNIDNEICIDMGVITLIINEVDF